MNYLSRKVTRAKQLGVTLVELLVGMILSLVVIAAASSVFLSSTQVFTTTDASSQLQDSARFATYLLRRMIQQAGYEDFVSGAGGAGGDVAANRASLPVDLSGAGVNLGRVLEVYGVNNGRISAQQLSANTAPASGTLPGGFFTDTVSVRFQGRSTYTASGALSADPDNSVIDCLGRGVPSSSTTAVVDRAFSSFFVNINAATNEPELYCSVLRADGSADTQPIVRGVESFQVLFEVGDDRTGLAPGPSGASLPDGAPEAFRFVRADQVAGLGVCNSQGRNLVSDTVNAWQNITAVRFGMVLRSELGAKVAPAAAEVFFPLGEAFGSAADPGTIYVAPLDTRLRRVVTFSVNVRNRGSSMQTVSKNCGEP